jgi:hypothetical protein
MIAGTEGILLRGHPIRILQLMRGKGPRVGRSQDTLLRISFGIGLSFPDELDEANWLKRRPSFSKKRQASGISQSRASQLAE